LDTVPEYVAGQLALISVGYRLFSGESWTRPSIWRSVKAKSIAPNRAGRPSTMTIDLMIVSRADEAADPFMKVASTP
jgi:hypothetical protein